MNSASLFSASLYSKYSTFPDSSCGAKDTDAKEQEEPQEELVQKIAGAFSWKEVLKLNIPDLHFLLPGLLFAAFFGILLPVPAIVFGEVVEVGLISKSL